MKKFTFFFSFLWLSFVALGQAPQGISYQTVIRDGAGQPLLNTAVTLKMTIRTAAPDGAVVYSETHPKTTGTFGLVTLAIGQGTPVEGNFAAINWGTAPHFLETAIDATGTGDFQILGVTQFLSVPYALNSLNGMPAGNNTGDMLYWDGSQWMKIAVGQNGQALILQNGIPTWGGVQLPILNTAAVTNITAFTAYSGGNIASDGGSPVVGRGICWNTSPNPTTGNFKIFAGSGSGNFLAQMTGLESSTQYFVRAFATNSAGTSYGQEMTFFTTAGAITLSTTPITNITVNSATSGGNITLNGGSPVTARGVCWNTAPYPTLAHNKTTDGSGNGAFVSQLTGLTNTTTYYVRAYATNSLGTSYGSQLTFTTLSGIVTLTTAEVTGITANSAISGGEITSDGGSPVTARGVCWNTSPNPTTANSFTSDGAGTGTFTSDLTGLAEDSTYYIRAYATNAFGTWYGNEMSFETPAWDCGNPFVDSRDGQIYNTVQIGEQCWMAENLNVGGRIDGGQNQLDNGAIEKYCYDNLETNCDVYGGLYQWDEMMGYSNLQGTKGICSEGWHLPADKEWTILTDYVSSIQEYLCNSNINYIAKALAANIYWNSSTYTCAVGNDINANNATNFTGLPGGYYLIGGSFSAIGNAGFWRTSNESTATNSYYRGLGINGTGLTHSSSSKSLGMSIRCIKGDSAQNQPPYYPFYPNPENGSSNISINLSFSWSCSDPESDPLTYDVFFGTENPPALVATAIADTFYNPGTLNYNTTYYWKIVAHDDHGNSTEGEIWSFTTKETWECGDILHDERDGQEYNTVQIGDQCWMAENLNVGTRIDGTQNQQDNGDVEKYCYDNLESNCDVYGGLYQWDEMMGYSTVQGVKGICPVGWHLPTDLEFTSLTNFVSGQPTYLCNSNAIFIAKALAASVYWNTNAGTCTIGNVLENNNATGFIGLPGGYRNNWGVIEDLGNLADWWSSTQYNATKAWYRNLSCNDAHVDRFNNNKVYGMSIRCLQDEITTINEPPDTPSNPIPETSSINNLIYSIFSWACSDPENDPLTYDVFFGTENPFAQIATAIADTFYTPGILNYNTTYYWKIVAHDDNGNSTEGEVWSFTTMDEPWACGDPLIDERDWQEYNTVQIGEQCWLKENIAYLPSVSPSSNGSRTTNYYYVYGYQGTSVTMAKTMTNYLTYGVLYNYPASLNACPQGWHLPTDVEWTTLTNYLGGESVAGGKMKETGTSHWNSPNNGATNSSDFTGLPGGWRSIEGTFSFLGQNGDFWSSTEATWALAWLRFLNNDDDDISRAYGDKAYGLSVRCLKDF